MVTFRIDTKWYKRVLCWVRPHVMHWVRLDQIHTWIYTCIRCGYIKPCVSTSVYDYVWNGQGATGKEVVAAEARLIAPPGTAITRKN